MKVTSNLSTFAIATLISLSFTTLAIAQGNPDYRENTKWNPTDYEVTQLPPYCQAEFRPEVYKARKAVDYGCGTGFNHFCPGLVVLNRAKNPLGTPKSRSYARGIAENTLARVASKMAPTCPLSADVNRALQQATMLRSVLK